MCSLIQVATCQAPCVNALFMNCFVALSTDAVFTLAKWSKLLWPTMRPPSYWRTITLPEMLSLHRPIAGLPIACGTHSH